MFKNEYKPYLMVEYLEQILKERARETDRQRYAHYRLNF